MLKMARNLSKTFQIITKNAFTRDLAYKKLPLPLVTGQRCLFTKSSLGLDVFDQHRERVKYQLSNLEDNFKTRMKDYIQDEKAMIFSEDLKNMIYLANNEEDVELTVAMIKRFNKQGKHLRFGSFKFGPIVMRMFHKFNKPELAIECFKDDEFDGFFTQLSTYQIFLDLLYENKMYKEVVENFERIVEKQIENLMYPRQTIVLVTAACYKLNTEESLDYILKLWKKLNNAGHFPTRRTVTFAAALALNKEKPEAALHILENTRNQGYTTIRNLKVLAMVQLGRFEDAIMILRSVLSIDRPITEIQTFNKDVIDKLRQKILESDNTQVIAEFNRIEDLFQKQGHIIETTLDEQLCSEIQSFSKSQIESSPRGSLYKPKQNFRSNYRQGLEDMV